MTIAYVTGGNADFFVTALALRESLKAHTDIDLHICDFGMTSPQCAYLDRQGWLLRQPQDLENAHPWACKAALGTYVETLHADAVVWLDADTLVLGDISSKVNALVAAPSKADLFVAADYGYPALKGFLEEFAMPDFAALLSSHGIDLGLPYLNSGVFICTNKDFFDRWPGVTNAVDHDEILFEQNAFNVLAHSDAFAVELLDSLEWNLHGDALGKIKVRRKKETPVVTAGTTRATVVHATSRDGRHQIVNRGKLAIGDRHELPYFMKWFRDDTLRDHQLAMLLRHISANFDQMLDDGVIVPKN